MTRTFYFARTAPHYLKAPLSHIRCGGRTHGLRHRGERSTAPIEHEGQSFLSNNIAFCRNRRSYQRFESHFLHQYINEINML
jgi:hypothetical protein